MPKTDIKNRDDILRLVTQFYTKVRADDVLGSFFNKRIKDWDTHLDQMTTFWESSLFLKTKYYGDPVAAHVKLDAEYNNGITELHFGLWLNLWFQTIDELFEGDYARNAKRRARKMGSFLYLSIFEARC
ncbi:group III truncated hemoglobin [uncultured Winogradskyella sp.]|uniref:group III truncated hemoglobin n=1 Tax=uncultured Winogradskyella sp. TaxID=395353 RepID=UPI002606AEEB|nr:group III truncated hemoglobin [uncultured Winogradskyella sp.]